MIFVDINTTYEKFVNLSEEDKFGYTFQVQYGKFEKKDYFSEIPLEKRSFGEIKDLMSAASEGEYQFIQQVMKIDDYSLPKILKRPAYEFIKTLEFISDKIVAFVEMENTQLVQQVHGKDYSSQLEQVDFSCFSDEYIQLRELANQDITKLEEIRKLPYETCFVELLYRTKQTDFERLVMQSNKLK